MKERHLFPFLLILLLSTYTFAADYEKGSVAAKNGDYATALKEWEPLAEQGDASGQNGLGWLYLTGNGVSRDYKIAFKLFTLSADQGFAKAQSNLGVMYAEGEGVTQDYQAAFKWYKLAAEQGLAGAQYNLGVMYAEGEGVTQDYQAAIKWYKLAADQGDAFAQNKLGNMYRQGHGVTQDFKYPELPNILDGKGLFPVSKSQAAQLKIKSAKVSDWLFNDDGELVDRDRHSFFEYDISGNISGFSGHKDQKGYIKYEYLYANNNLFEEKYYIKTEDEWKFIAKESFKYFDGDQSESIVIDNIGNIKGRKEFVYDTAGNNVEISLNDANGNTIGTMTKKFDEFGNILEKVAGNVKEVYSYDKHKITISRLTQNNQLHSTSEYTFDNNWNLLTYLRKSGDGEFWDRFTYKYNADALPIEKVWSRKEYLVQDPYQLTKYSYQHFK